MCKIGAIIVIATIAFHGSFQYKTKCLIQLLTIFLAFNLVLVGFLGGNSLVKDHIMKVIHLTVQVEYQIAICRGNAIEKFCY